MRRSRPWIKALIPKMWLISLLLGTVALITFILFTAVAAQSLGVTSHGGAAWLFVIAAVCSGIGVISGVVTCLLSTTIVRRLLGLVGVLISLAPWAYVLMVTRW